MKVIYLIVFSFFSFLINAQETFTEADLFAQFKEVNHCWYNTEEKMVEESDKIINIQKKNLTYTKIDDPKFWEEVTRKIKIRYPDFDYSTCNKEDEVLDDESAEDRALASSLAEVWEKNNPWFGEDADMTSFAIDVHIQLVEKGLDPDSQVFHDTLDEKMREKFTDYFTNVKNQSSDNGNETILETDYYTLTIDGNNLIFEGSIETDLFIDLKDILKKNPAVTHLILKSEGGLEEEALEIANIIIDYGLDTHAYNCESSCTILFAAGEKRTLQRGFKLGFHRTYWSANNLEAYYEYYIDNYDSVFDFTEWVHDDTQDSLFIKFQYFLEREVDPLFIIKTLRAKSDGMWYPRRKELLNANFITE